jgi:nucleoside-diphosphate-sugar epimerase
VTFPGQRVLITGASGFVGACLARRLIEDGCQVHCLLRGEGAPWRLAGLAGRYVRHTADLRDRDAVRAAFRASRPNVIYHLAAHGTSAHQRDRAAILATNFLGTAHVLDAAAELAPQNPLVHTGSSSEYGHKSAPMCPGDVLEPRTDYAVAKAAATLLCQAESRQGRPITTVRIFTAYGPWDDPGRLVPAVMAACLRGEAPAVTSGDQPRDFVYIDDVLDLLLLAATTPAARGRILHAGTGRKQTVREMVEAIVAVCSDDRLRPDIGAVAQRRDEPRCWVADIEETTALTGWRPGIDLRAGIARTWRWLQRWAARLAG